MPNEMYTPVLDYRDIRSRLVFITGRLFSSSLSSPLVLFISNDFVLERSHAIWCWVNWNSLWLSSLIVRSRKSGI